MNTGTERAPLSDNGNTLLTIKKSVVRIIVGTGYSGHLTHQCGTRAAHHYDTTVNLLPFTLEYYTCLYQP